eukprot:gene14495-5557_t
MADRGDNIDDLVREYFFKGFTYKEICLFLQRNHGCIVSLRTLKRKIKRIGLRRPMPDYEMDSVRATVGGMLDGPQSNLGYRAVWHDLQMKGIRVPRNIVANLLRELDPQGVQERRAHRLKRRAYQNLGPNEAWHCDGNGPDSHRYVPSPRNQRIESWWAFFRRTHTSWWIIYFKDLTVNEVDMTRQLHSECLWFCYAPLLQRCLNRVKDHWNCHYIRRSRHDTVTGRPDSLYYLPDINGGLDNLILPVPEQEYLYAKDHVISTDEENQYQQYFEYVKQVCDLRKPDDWRSAQDLFETIMRYAEADS